MSDLQFRCVQSDDATLLADIHTQCFAKPWGEAAMASLLVNGTIGWIASMEKKDVGLALIRLAADEAELLSLATIPSARCKGAGRSLLKTVCQQAKLAGAQQMFLEVRSDNAPAVHIYERAGFTRIGSRENYYANHVDAVTFMRPLI